MYAKAKTSFSFLMEFTKWCRYYILRKQQ